MTPHPATPEDAADLARIHIAAWAETYPGLLPPEAILAETEPGRRAWWDRALREGAVRVALLPGFGFAAMGVQRDDALAADGFAEEVHALYLLRAGQGRGHGRALLRAVWGGRPATALVVEGVPACGFYERVGARHLATRDARIGVAPIRERVYAWPDGALR